MMEKTKRATTRAKERLSRGNFFWTALWLPLLVGFFFISPSFSQQIAFALHASWDPDLTDNSPSVCTTSGTVAIPSFHFYATKVLKWDPVRGIADTIFSYSLECAQRKVCDVYISIYSTDGAKVYETWLEQESSRAYSFTWDGTVNVAPPPDGLAPIGLYVFDIEVM